MTVAWSGLPRQGSAGHGSAKSWCVRVWTGRAWCGWADFGEVGQGTARLGFGSVGTGQVGWWIGFEGTLLFVLRRQSRAEFEHQRLQLPYGFLQLVDAGGGIEFGFNRRPQGIMGVAALLAGRIQRLFLIRQVLVGLAQLVEERSQVIGHRSEWLSRQACQDAEALPEEPGRQDEQRPHHPRQQGQAGFDIRQAVLVPGDFFGRSLRFLGITRVEQGVVQRAQTQAHTPSLAYGRGGMTRC